MLLLNNDIEPTYGWLNEMVGCILNNENVGSVGAKLIFPYYDDMKSQEKSYSIQHAGIKFREERTPYVYGPYHENMFSKLVQCVKTTETSRWIISGEKKLCWSPFKNAGEFKEGEINKYEAFTFSAYKCPFFEAGIAGVFIYSPSDSINTDPFSNSLYYTRDVIVSMMPIEDSSSLYSSAAAYCNVGQANDMYNDASMVILRSPMVSPEYEEVTL